MPAGSILRRHASDRCDRLDPGPASGQYAVPSACGTGPSELLPTSCTPARKKSPGDALLARWCAPDTRDHPDAAAPPRSVQPAVPSAGVLTVFVALGYAVRWDCS